MRILLVDNNTVHKEALKKSLSGHKVQTQFYHPGLKINDSDFDLVILSGGGGEGNEIDDIGPTGDLWYKDEMSYVKLAKKPIIGICMGFEVICRAYGEKVEEMSDTVQGFKQLNTAGRVKSLRKSKIKQYEAHKWRVKAVREDVFDVMAFSDTGVEMISYKNKDRPKIIATQFHPEIPGGSISLKQLVNNLATA